ncbi:methionine--tRNA ligase [Citricoccus zhacaiensis]|uniref:Methionine--tRNA ligase n=1 Tax=Citricoccus zhacaiensis TaxID=489142 RepID=A0ABQ2LM34_9MICC|nr:methionine--tRNA ligase [Citricoccus zhacaiensis]GGO39906.1 methionine--tRNA ligase [Citricoccus zhacaiensis]
MTSPDAEPQNQTPEREPYYLTTAISYPNGEPHIGHAYEFVGTDVMARFQRLDGKDVYFLTGTDEHGQKMQQTAQAEGITALELATRNSAAFKAVDDEVLDISYDRFIRTTDADHTLAVQEIWRRMEAAGDIYLDQYAGWYSVRDERFFGEDETEVRPDGKRYATETGTEVTWTEEESYFFRLSQYQDRLLELYHTRPDFAAPQSRFNEVIRFVESGLEDLSISRTSFDWGIEVPAPAAGSGNRPTQDHVMYVWVDALTNYLTGAGFPAEDSEQFRFWPADLHVIGKDISRFHCIFWPAFLMSAGLELPRRVMIHGFLNNNGEKMSKSLGNVVGPAEWVEHYGLDAVRYFLLREFPFGADGSYSHEAVVGRKNADLANNLGNLAQRSLSMVAKNLDGVVPQPGEYTGADRALLDAAAGLLDTARADYRVQDYHHALEVSWALLGDANAYFAEQQPWVLRKTDPARMATVLYVTLETVRRVALLVQPVMPGSAAKLLDFLGIAPSGDAGRTGASGAGPRSFAAWDEALVPGSSLPAPQPVFPRHEEPDAG